MLGYRRWPRVGRWSGTNQSRRLTTRLCSSWSQACDTANEGVPTCSYQRRRAASMAAMSIFFIVIIASKARFASSPPVASASVSVRGVICQDRPQRSLHQPHALSVPPLPTIAFQYRSVSSWSVRRDLERKGLGVPERRAAVETKTGDAHEGELHREHIAFLAARIVTGRSVNGGDLTIRKGRSIEARRLVRVR